MAYYSNDHVEFGTKISGTTSTLGVNDPELGTRANIAGNEYVFVYNDGLAAGIGQLVVVQSGSSGYSVTASSVIGLDVAMGVAKNVAIANAKYGWVMTRGFSKVECVSNVVSGGLLTPGTNGQAADPTVGASTGTTGFVFARAQEQTIACGAAMSYVNCF
jgi:hypothetical protein